MKLVESECDSKIWFVLLGAVGDQERLRRVLVDSYIVI